MTYAQLWDITPLNLSKIEPPWSSLDKGRMAGGRGRPSRHWRRQNGTIRDNKAQTVCVNINVYNGHDEEWGAIFLISDEPNNNIEFAVEVIWSGGRLYRVVQLNLIPEIEVFYMLLDRFHPIFSRSSLKQHIQSCAEKRDCFVKHQPGVAGCGWLQPGRNFLSTYSSSIYFAQPCTYVILKI